MQFGFQQCGWRLRMNHSETIVCNGHCACFVAHCSILLSLDFCLFVCIGTRISGFNMNLASSMQWAVLLASKNYTKYYMSALVLYVTFDVVQWVYEYVMCKMNTQKLRQKWSQMAKIWSTKSSSSRSFFLSSEEIVPGRRWNEYYCLCVLRALNRLNCHLNDLLKNNTHEIE